MSTGLQGPSSLNAGIFQTKTHRSSGLQGGYGLNSNNKPRRKRSSRGPKNRLAIRVSVASAARNSSNEFDSLGADHVPAGCSAPAHTPRPAYSHLRVTYEPPSRDAVVRNLKMQGYSSSSKKTSTRTGKRSSQKCDVRGQEYHADPSRRHQIPVIPRLEREIELRLNKGSWNACLP
ncbi:unnamed protein product [Amoebophrya sp. A25]|nr:unnamed protein product [Amoebophrya sp. A25]|eukprot:GSA25T00013196001.1